MTPKKRGQRCTQPRRNDKYQDGGTSESELLILREGDRTGRIENPDPQPRGAAWDAKRAGHKRFLPPWKCPRERGLPGVGGGGTSTAQAFSRTGGGDPAWPRVPGAAAEVGRNAHFYIKQQQPKKKPQPNRQHGHFWAAWLLSQPELLSGRRAGARGGGPLPDPIQERLRAGARGALCTGRRGPGRCRCAGGTAAEWPRRGGSDS